MNIAKSSQTTIAASKPLTMPNQIIEGKLAGISRNTGIIRVNNVLLLLKPGERGKINSSDYCCFIQPLVLNGQAIEGKLVTTQNKSDSLQLDFDALLLLKPNKRSQSKADALFVQLLDISAKFCQLFKASPDGNEMQNFRGTRPYPNPILNTKH